MSGHSKWAGIKHKKAIIDAKRGKVFTKVIREITVAAREGGGNVENNARLRKIIETARNANMPQDNIKKAVQRGTGEIPGVMYEEVVYEGYGPAGVAVIIEGTTDNRNRTASEIRKMFSSHGGNMGESGCVSWMFSQKGYIGVEKSKFDEEKLMSLALENGAEDFRTDDEDFYEVLTTPADFEGVKQALEKAGVPIANGEVTMQPQTYIKLTGKDAERMLALMDDLEAHDDVKNVYANFDISEKEMEAIEAGNK
ncbi:MAG: transcriptional regulator [Elusimicrobia bacterium RIFOXYA2_FULL_50_26]|nr:MAG: transcriptional regulator [Elusimicrobia bacterium RIFOXYA2_FULL_50_26]OGS24839.1 MAG: transcriptional regulator [Elusimicrobia bacterium RIFOXYB2_FULL_50_12]